MTDVQCPYCGEEQEIDHDGGYGYDEGIFYDQECFGCQKVFAFETIVHYSYKARKADCLNGGDHQWEFDYGFCVACGELLGPTE